MSNSSQVKGLQLTRAWPTGIAMSIILFLFGFLLMVNSGQAATCGDANSDEMINVGDVVYIISFVFNGGPPPQFLCDGDVNGDGVVNVGDAVYLIQWVFRGGPPPDCLPPWLLNEYTGCKVFWKSGYPPDVDCMVYQYEGGILKLNHINAGFNCCPEQIVVDIQVVGDTILIEESEINGMCFCLCLFDLEMQINYLEPGEYLIRVIEPYLAENDEPLEFTIDLVAEPAGAYCVPRLGYPWEEPPPPNGSTIGYSGCKYLRDNPADTLPPNQDCLFYEYDGQNTLTVTHANTCFNCCILSTQADFAFDSNTVTITESEVLDGGGCDCLCLYDVDYEITGLIPGVYVLQFNGMYLRAGEEPLVVTLDLTSAIGSSFCVARNIYPWWE